MKVSHDAILLGLNAGYSSRDPRIVKHVSCENVQIVRRACVRPCNLFSFIGLQGIIVGMKVINSRGEILLQRVTWCASFGTKLRGLMFRRSLADDEGLVLAESRSSIAATSIHMFFVPFDIAAIWLDDKYCVVHTVLAKAWHPYYASPVAARYVLEGPPALLQRVAVGEQLRFEE